MEPLKHECGVAMVRLLKPLEYYHNNITGTLNLCDVMRNFGVKNIHNKPEGIDRLSSYKHPDRFDMWVEDDE